MTLHLQRQLKSELILNRGLYPRQTDATDQCIENCFGESLSEALDLCNAIDIQCMCGNSKFRAHAKECLASKCGYTRASDAQIIDQVLDECVAGSLSTSSTTSSLSTSTSTSTSTRSSPSSHTASSTSPGATPSSVPDGTGKVSTGAIVGGVVGGILVIALTGCFIWWFVQRSNQKRQLASTPGAYVPPTPGSTFKTGTSVSPPTSPGFPGMEPFVAVPPGDMGYVPPSQFMQYDALGPTTADARPMSHVSSTSLNAITSTHAQYQYGYMGPTSVPSDGVFNPYVPYAPQQQSPASFHRQ
ncbi:hypothetical protein BKA62DRAFT_42503 [Auriculariales sp. MPI-PUGE-AT-0066]|nr:hypothetical protein BKA62DRAFT_42503 [Auriculariales sp. MPI-PUGE-AT-0066]